MREIWMLRCLRSYAFKGLLLSFRTVNCQIRVPEESGEFLVFANIFCNRGEEKRYVYVYPQHRNSARSATALFTGIRSFKGLLSA